MQRTITLRDGRTATIRDAEIADAAEFIRHRKKTCGETDYLICYADEVTLTVEEEKRILEAIAADPKRSLIICDYQGSIVGFSGVSPKPPFPNKHIGHTLPSRWSVPSGDKVLVLSSSPPVSHVRKTQASRSWSLAATRRTSGPSGSTNGRGLYHGAPAPWP